MVPRLGLPHLVVVGVSAVLALATGLVAGLANRGEAGSEPPLDIWSPPGLVGPEHYPAPTAGLQLRDLAAPRQLLVGSAVNMDAFEDQRYRDVLAAEFNAVTAENAMKWSAVEPARGVYHRAPADQLVAFARAHGQAVYGHTLVWHKQVPSWVEDGAFSDTQLREILRRHIEDEVSYFRDRVWAWDVVNEALDQDGRLRESLWLQRLGPSYVADAFRWARAADPAARLFINDFGIEGINAKSDALYELVVRLLAQGVPIDGVGFQLHWTLDPLPSTFAENLRRFSALGLDIAITELDVRMPEPVTPENLDRQAIVYRQAIDGCLATQRCVSFTVWGFTDAHSWVPDAYPGSGAAALFDSELNPKPAYAAVVDALVRDG